MKSESEIKDQIIEMVKDLTLLEEEVEHYEKSEFKDYLAVVITKRTELAKRINLLKWVIDL